MISAKEAAQKFEDLVIIENKKKALQKEEARKVMKESIEYALKVSVPIYLKDIENRLWNLKIERQNISFIPHHHKLHLWKKLDLN